MREIIFRIGCFISILFLFWIIGSYMAWDTNIFNWLIFRNSSFEIKYYNASVIDYFTLRAIILSVFIFSIIFPPPIFKAWRSKKISFRIFLSKPGKGKFKVF